MAKVTSGNNGQARPAAVEPAIKPPGTVLKANTHGLAQPLANPAPDAQLRKLLGLSGEASSDQVARDAAEEIRRLREQLARR